MSYILLIVLVLEILFIYKCNGKNVVSPSFIACAMFILPDLYLIYFYLGI